MDKSKKKIPFKRALENNWYIFKLAYDIYPKRIAASLIMNFFWYFAGYYYSIIFSSIVYKAIIGSYSFKVIVIFIAANSAFFLLLQVINSWYLNKYVPETDLIFKEKLNLMIFDKSYEIELACYENTEFYNQYTRAAAEANERIISMIENISRTTGLLITAVLTIIVICSLNPFSFIFILFPMIFRFLIDTRMNKARYEFNNAKTPHNRAKSYVNRVIYLEQYAKDIRVTDVFNLLKKRYDEGVDGIIKNIKIYGRKIAKYRAIQDGIEKVMRYPILIAYSAASVLVFNLAAPDQFIVLMNAISRFIWSFNDFFGLFTKMQEDGLFIQNFRDFMDYRPKISQKQEGIKPGRDTQTLELRNVSFSYDGSDKKILSGINMKINKGEKIALVGSNGAGKTTLIKLIMRLYDVSEGEILLNGINIKEYNVEKYRDLYGTVFQDYKIFSMSVADNVMMRKAKPEDAEVIINALKDSGIYEKIMSGEKGINQILTREFADDGLVLSGGEFQKLAIARAFSKPCDIVILDEPSSALDPLAEYKVFESMKRVCEDKTVLFISHRLSTAILADKVYMMEDGKIVESGTHEELMKKNGKYAEMFAKQSQMYLGRFGEMA